MTSLIPKGSVDPGAIARQTMHDFQLFLGAVLPVTPRAQRDVRSPRKGGLHPLWELAVCSSSIRLC